MPIEWDEGDIDPDESVYAHGRLPSRTYASKSFQLNRTNSEDHGAPARFLYKVFDPDTESMVTREADEWVVRETPKGRYQVKLLVAREPGNLKELWIHRVPTAGGDVELLLNLKQPEAGRLVEYLKLMDVFPIEGGGTVRLDDEVLAALLEDPDSLRRMYHRSPGRLRQLIQSDVAAEDVIALEARRKAIERFRRLLEDDDYFDREASARSGPEAVWQQLFETNPWMLGLSLSGQLLTQWDADKLEQVVVGSSISERGKRTDALLRTAGRVKSMVLAEIKTHRTKLLGSEYRSGCWPPSVELSGAITQLQGTIHRAVKHIGDRLQEVDETGADLPGEFTYLLRPRGFVIAGTLDEFLGGAGGGHQDRITSFELFRRQLQEPEILTFDEILSRAEWSLSLSAS